VRCFVTPPACHTIRVGQALDLEKTTSTPASCPRPDVAFRITRAIITEVAITRAHLAKATVSMGLASLGLQADVMPTNAVVCAIATNLALNEPKIALPTFRDGVAASCNCNRGDHGEHSKTNLHHDTGYRTIRFGLHPERHRIHNIVPRRNTTHTRRAAPQAMPLREPLGHRSGAPFIGGRGRQPLFAPAGAPTLSSCPRPAMLAGSHLGSWDKVAPPSPQAAQPPGPPLRGPRFAWRKPLASLTAREKREQSIHFFDAPSQRQQMG